MTRLSARAFIPDAEGRAGRRRGDVPQADGAGRADPPAGGRALDLPARRLAGRAQGRGDHPRGDGGDRLPGDADAGAAAGRELGEDRALRDRRAVQARGPQGVADGAGDDPRGGGHLPRRPRGPLLPRPAADALPHPDQGARRAAAAGRGPAHARVHDEGRLLLRPRRGGAGALLRAAGGRLRAHLRPLRAALVPGRVRRRDDGRLRRPRVHGALRRRARTRWRWRPATPPTSRSPRPSAQPVELPAPLRAPEEVVDARPGKVEEVSGDARAARRAP